MKYMLLFNKSLREKEELPLNTTVIESTRICAERGWKATFHLLSGEILRQACITATDWDRHTVLLERAEERHLDPRLIFLSEVEQIDVHWG